MVTKIQTSFLPQKTSLNCLLSAFIGGLMPLAFAPFSFWPLIFIFISAIIWIGLEVETPVKTFLVGWSFGIGYFGVGLYWIYNSLHDFGNAPPLVASFLTALLAVYLALFPAFTLWLWKKLLVKSQHRWFWFLPILWFAAEWLKGWIITGMPWLSLGYSQIDSALAGFAPLVGVYGLSSLIVLISLALIRTFQSRAYQYLTVPIVVLLVGFGLQSVSWTEIHGDPIDVAMVQGNIPQEMKWQRSQRQKIFDIYWEESNQLWSNDLIVWPETALPGRSEEIEQSVLIPMSMAAAESETSLLTGIVVTKSQENIYYNSMLMLGESQGEYHKRHLVVFGEYYPMRWLIDSFRHLINIPFSDMTPGPEQQPLMAVDGQKLGIGICFEDVFSRDVMLDLPEANILVNASNDAWFGDSFAPHQHLEIAQMRALETGRPMIRATNTGVSAFIDSKGRIEKKTGQFEMRSLVNSVQGRQGLTPFYYFEKGQGGIAIFVVLFSIISLRKKAAIH